MVFSLLAPFAWVESRQDGAVRHEPSGSCLPCPPGALCGETDATASISTLRLEDAHWRPSLSSLDVRPCPIPELCRGALGASDAQCVRDPDPAEAALGAANAGPMCQLCAEGGYPQSNGVCVACATSGVWVALTGAVGVLLLCAVLGWFCAQMWNRYSSSSTVSYTLPCSICHEVNAGEGVAAAAAPMASARITSFMTS